MSEDQTGPARVDPYPEHTKLSRVSDTSQAQGELLEWLQGQGVHLMTWREWTETVPCGVCIHLSEYGVQRCHCARCNGTHEVEAQQEGWVPYGKTIADILASFHGIDQGELEREKRAALKELNRQAASAVVRDYYERAKEATRADP